MYNAIQLHEMQGRITIRFIPQKEKLEMLEREYPDFNPLYGEAIQALFQLSVDLEKGIDQFHLKNGFSRSRFLVLLVLMHEEGNRLTPHEIAVKLNVTRGNMTGLIDCLMKDGLVKKFEDGKDRRKVWIEMTPKARQFLKRVFPDYFKRLARLMSVITRDEIEALIRISRKLNGAMGAFND